MARALTAAWVEQFACGRGHVAFRRFAVAAIHGEAAEGDPLCIARVDALLDGDRDSETDLERGLVSIWNARA